LFWGELSVSDNQLRLHHFVVELGTKDCLHVGNDVAPGGSAGRELINGVGLFGSASGKCRDWPSGSMGTHAFLVYHCPLRTSFGGGGSIE
jgi:hypothetical protein